MRLATQQTASRASAKHLGSSDRTRSAICLAELLLPGLGRHIVCTPGGCIALRQSTNLSPPQVSSQCAKANLKAIRCHEALRYTLQNHIAAHSRFRINKQIPTPLHQASQSYKIFLCSQSVGRYLNEEFLRAAQPLNLPRLGPESWTVRDSRVEPSTLRLNITDVPTSIAEPSTLKAETVEGSIPQARTLHENAPHHGRFIIQSGTLRAEARNRGRFHSADPNPPRKRPASWKVHPPERNLPR